MLIADTRNLVKYLGGTYVIFVSNTYSERLSLLLVIIIIMFWGLLAPESPIPIVTETLIINQPFF